MQKNQRNNHQTKTLDIDTVLALSKGELPAPLNIEQYQEALNSEATRQQHLLLLAQNWREQKKLQQQQLTLLRALADPEKKDKLFTVVSSVHLGILQEEDPCAELEDIMTSSLANPVDLTFLLQNKNSKFYRSAEVMDKHSEHPVQQTLVKRKYIGRRSVKKQKTPMQHFNHLMDAKVKMQKDDRLLALENSMLETRQALALLANNQVELQQQLGTVQKDLATLQEKEKDLRKLKLYVLINNSKRITNQKLAESLDVSPRTIKRWKKELKDEGYL